MTTPYWSDFIPNSTSTEFWVVSIEHLRRVWHADRRRLLLRTPGPVPLGLAYVLLVETNPFPNLSLFYLDMLFEYPSVLSRFCFSPLLWIVWDIKYKFGWISKTLTYRLYTIYIWLGIFKYPKSNLRLFILHIHRITCTLRSNMISLAVVNQFSSFILRHTSHQSYIHNIHTITH